MKQQSGNGDTQRNILMQEQAAGHVVFSPENLLDIPDQHFAHLSMLFSNWLRENPKIVVKETLAISDTSGQTVILRVWFDQVASQ